MKKFIPVKIIDKKWADKLMGGELFFRALVDFRPNRSNDLAIKNEYRGDTLEGTISAYTDMSKCEYAQWFAEKDRELFREFYTTDEGDLPYFKLFCMTALEYDEQNKRFVQPDLRLKQFGDTAVIFRDFNELLKRFLIAVKNENEKVLILANLINYYSPKENRKLMPLFEKHFSYEWENELRLAYGELTDEQRLVCDTESKTFNIGRISDIAVEVPVDSFLDLSFLKMRIPLRFPVADDVKPPMVKHKTILDMIVEDTEKELKDFESKLNAFSFTT